MKTVLAPLALVLLVFGISSTANAYTPEVEVYSNVKVIDLPACTKLATYTAFYETQGGFLGARKEQPLRVRTRPMEKGETARTYRIPYTVINSLGGFYEFILVIHEQACG